MFEWIRQGGADTVTATVRELTGADARPVEGWLENSGRLAGPRAGHAPAALLTQAPMASAVRLVLL